MSRTPGRSSAARGTGLCDFLAQVPAAAEAAGGNRYLNGGCRRQTNLNVSDSENFECVPTTIKRGRARPPRRSLPARLRVSESFRVPSGDPHYAESGPTRARGRRQHRNGGPSDDHCDDSDLRLAAGRARPGPGLGCLEPALTRPRPAIPPEAPGRSRAGGARARQRRAPARMASPNLVRVSFDRRRSSQLEPAV